MKSGAFACIGLAFAGLALPAAASAQTAATEEVDDRPAPAPARPRAIAPQTIWQLGSGISYSNGDYGRTVDTSVVSVPINLRVRRGPWSLRVATSFTRIEGPASVVDAGEGEGGADGGGVGGAPNETRSGLSDFSVTLARRIDLSETTSLNGELRVKVPTASQSKRLTNGNTELTARARISQEIGDFSLRAGVQRRFAGDDGPTELRDGWGLSGGASLDLGDRVVAGADLNWTESAYIAGRPNTSVLAFVSAPLSRRIRLTGYGGTGLSSNSADLTLGVSVSARLD